MLSNWKPHGIRNQTQRIVSESSLFLLLIESSRLNNSVLEVKCLSMQGKWYDNSKYIVENFHWIAKN